MCCEENWRSVRAERTMDKKCLMCWRKMASLMRPHLTIEVKSGAKISPEISALWERAFQKEGPVSVKALRQKHINYGWVYKCSPFFNLYNIQGARYKCKILGLMILGWWIGSCPWSLVCPLRFPPSVPFCVVSDYTYIWISQIILSKIHVDSALPTAASWLPLESRVCTAAVRPVLRESDRVE